MKAFTKVDKRRVALELINNSYYQLALKYGIDRYYKNKRSALAFIHRMYQEVRANPQKFNLTQDMIESIDSALQLRRKRDQKGQVLVSSNITPEEVPKEELSVLDRKELVKLARKNSWIVLNKKINMILKSHKMLKLTPLNVLAQAAGITFDKEQITRGEATEHILMKSNIDVEHLTPAERINELLKMSEKINTEKE